MSLTELETKILRSVVSSSGRRLSIDELAAVTGCSTETIYNRLMKKAEFQELFKEALTNSLIPEMPEVLNSFIDEGKKGSFKHGKLLLEITSIYKENKKITADVNVHESEEPFKSAEERKAFLKETLSGIIMDDQDTDTDTQDDQEGDQ